MDRRQSRALIVIGLLCWPAVAFTFGAGVFDPGDRGTPLFLAGVGLLLAFLGWAGGGGLRRELDHLRPRAGDESREASKPTE